MVYLSASHPVVWQETNLKGETPLFVAVDKYLVKNVHFLLLNGFNPDVKNEEGDSALITGKWNDSVYQAVFAHCGGCVENRLHILNIFFLFHARIWNTVALCKVQKGLLLPCPYHPIPAIHISKALVSHHLCLPW